MMISKTNIQEIFQELDLALQQDQETREIIIFGSAALMSLSLLERGTVDIDIVDPEIDNKLQLISAAIGEKYGLEFGWLNSAGHIFSKKFPQGWKGRCQVLFSGRHLTVKALHRKDLIATKLYSAGQRGRRDIEDLVELEPSSTELEFAKKWTLQREKHVSWKNHIEAILNEIETKMRTS